MTEDWMQRERDLMLAVDALDASKALDILALDLRHLSDATDFFIVASGSSDAHVRAVGERLIESLAKEGIKPHHIEGLRQGRWVLIDYVDFVVHLFHPTLREFYQLERLWADAPAATVGSAD